MTKETPQEAHDSTRAFDTSDDNLGTLFLDGLEADSNGYRERLRYINATGRWVRWNGRRWQIDETGKAVLLMQEHLRRFAVRLFKAHVDAMLSPNGRFAIDPNDNEIVKRYKRHKAKAVAIERIQKLKSTAKCSSVLQHVAVRQNVASSIDMWDADAWLLSTPDGVVDLRTGNMRPPDPKLYMTKMAGVSPRSGQAPMWEQFLKTITRGDSELQSYLQRVAGYCLTGSVHAQTFFFGHGSGQNGKSVFVNTLSFLLGDYYQRANMSTFMKTKHERHPTDLAALCGARFVTASEIERGAFWNEERIKELTGDDPIHARFLYKDGFTYMPQFKLFLIGNNKPRLSGVNEAIRRRVQLIPFLAQIPHSARDEHLREKLCTQEGPFIMHWALEGCLAFQSLGLQPPELVRAATDEYMEYQDPFKDWFEAACTFTDAFTPTAELYASWREFAERNGEYAGSYQHFKEAVYERSVGQNVKLTMRRVEGQNMRGFWGIRLTADEEPTPRAFRRRAS